MDWVFSHALLNGFKVQHKKPFDYNTDPEKSKCFMVCCLNCHTKVLCQNVCEQKNERHANRRSGIFSAPLLQAVLVAFHHTDSATQTRRGVSSQQTAAGDCLVSWTKLNRNSLMLAWKENVSVHCKLFIFPHLRTLTWQSVPGISVFDVRRVSSGVPLVCRVVNSFLQEMATTNRTRTDAQTTGGEKLTCKLFKNVL